MEQQAPEKSKIINDLNRILINMKKSGDTPVQDIVAMSTAINYLESDDKVMQIESLKKENTQQSYTLYVLKDDKRLLEKDNYRLIRENNNLREEISALRRRNNINIFDEM